MSRVCFGQNFEDVVLWRALGHVAKGQYLDIGAQHPVIDSVSRSFYLAGWRGIHVEPVPFYAAALRADRPDETVIEAAVGSGSERLVIHAIEGTGLSTGQADVAAAHKAAGHAAVPIEVDKVTLAALLDRFAGQELHWLKIDVEGMEAEVLTSWGESPVRPWIVLIEAIDPATAEPTDGQWRALIEQRGYHEILFDGVSRFFVANEHAELDESLGLPANCLDAFAVPWHHWAAANAVDQFRTEVAQANAAAAQARTEREQAGAALANAIADRQRAERERSYLTERLDDLQGERAVLARALDQLGEELAARRLEVDQLQAQVRDASRRTEAIIAQLQTAREQLARAGQQQEELAAHGTRLEAALAERDAALERQRIELGDLSEVRTGLEQQLARQAVQLHRADRIAGLAAAVLGSWYTIVFGTLFKKGRQVRRDLRNALRDWSSALSQQSAIAHAMHKDEIETMDLFAYERRDPFQRAPSLGELCRFADRDFIRCAFVTLLGRQPDPDGEAHYLDRLRSGDSMFSILWSLRKSSEGQAHDPGIAGLDRVLRKHRNANLPLIGWLIRLLTKREGNSATERRLRIISNMLAVERNLAASRAATANHLQVMMIHQIDGVEKQLKVALAGQTMTPRQIAQAEASGDTEWEATLASVLTGR